MDQIEILMLSSKKNCDILDAKYYYYSMPGFVACFLKVKAASLSREVAYVQFKIKMYL